MKKILFILFHLVLAHCLLEAQAVLIKGRVTDDKGSPLAGVSVVRKNTTHGTTTAADGSSTLSAPTGARLAISAVGYEPSELTAAPSLNIKLTPGSSTLTDVVVTGVGVGTSKRRVPIDVATVSSKDFA